MPNRNGHQSGFRLKRKTITLAFADGDWQGAKVVCLGKVPASMVLDFMAFADRKTGNLSDLTQGEQETVTGLLRTFGDTLLLEWDLIDESGAPIPATADGLLKNLDLEECLYLIGAWMEGIRVAATAPLGKPGSKLSTVLPRGGGNSRVRSSRKTAG